MLERDYCYERRLSGFPEQDHGYHNRAPEKMGWVCKCNSEKLKNNVGNNFHMEEQLLPVLFQGGIQKTLRCNPNAEPATGSGKAVRR